MPTGMSKRRYATVTLGTAFRGLKSTATGMASLRDFPDGLLEILMRAITQKSPAKRYFGDM
jgi:hypothetical protein